jgi:hypothetical protein
MGEILAMSQNRDQGREWAISPFLYEYRSEYHMLLGMLEEVSIAGLRARQAERRARIVAGVQSVVISLLLVTVAEDYNHNQYFEEWASANLGGFGFLLNGTLATFYAGVLVAMFLRRLPD